VGKLHNAGHDILLAAAAPPAAYCTCAAADGKDLANLQKSSYIASETTVDAVLEGHIGFGVVHFTVQQVRDAFAEFNKLTVICRHEEEQDKGHVVICGKATPGLRNRMKQNAQWVEGRWPARNPPPMP
jgi:polyisoprenoid-binding protein YceI